MNDAIQMVKAFNDQGVAVIVLHAPYISHGEIQTGLSNDGETWVTDLEARYTGDFLDLGEERDLYQGSLM